MRDLEYRCNRCKNSQFVIFVHLKGRALQSPAKYKEILIPKTDFQHMPVTLQLFTMVAQRRKNRMPSSVYSNGSGAERRKSKYAKLHNSSRPRFFPRAHACAFGTDS
jgi:hypothetical protein